MARTKISEFSATPANNTDIDSINIAEGCAPSGINDAIRELMSQLKDFQAGTAGDSFNGPVGTTTAAAGAFTNLTASGTLGVTGATTLSSALTYGGVTLSNAVTGTGNMVLSNSPTLVTPALGTPASGVVTNLTGTASININGTVGATTATTGAFTTLAASGAVTLSGGTANGVPYLNGSKVLTSGSALTFDGTTFSNTTNAALAKVAGTVGWVSIGDNSTGAGALRLFGGSTQKGWQIGSNLTVANALEFSLATMAGGATFTDQQMILTSTGLGIGTSSPNRKLDVRGTDTWIKVAENSVASWLIGTGTTNALRFFDESSAERMRIDSSGNLLVGTTSGSYKVDVSGDVNVTGSYRVNGVATTGLTGGQTGSAPLYGARAWVNFNGTGTVAIRASGNVSSITDNGTGDYTVNFTTAMPDVKYSVGVGGAASADEQNRAFGEVIPSVFAVGSFKVRTGYNVADSTALDYVFVCCNVFR